MKYFLDTEFLEGTQKTLFGNTKPTIDLISIGIVAEDGREYYAISKDFNLKEAWNRWQQRTGEGDRNNVEPRLYWIRENILKPIWRELVQKWALEEEKANRVSCTTGYNPPIKFTYKCFKKLINKYGKTNKQIAEEVKEFVYCAEYGLSRNKPNNSIKIDSYLDEDRLMFTDNTLKEHPCGNISDFKNIQFYGYYSDYDWVVFCWLFGKMIDLPKGFPMFAFDIQQQIEEYKINKERLLKEVPQINCHNSLHDAIWNKDAYNWIQKKIK